MVIVPTGPEDIIKFSVMPSGKNLSLIKDQCTDFFLNDQKNEVDSDLNDMWLPLLHIHLAQDNFSTDKLEHGHLK